MRHQAQLTSPAQRDLNHLPEAVATAVLAFIQGPLVRDPRRVGESLLGSRSGQWSARRGEYRVIYTINDQTVTVTVIRMQHRRHAYR